MNLSTAAFTHWKSTLSSLLTASLTATAALVGAPGIQTILSQKTLIILGAVQAVAKVTLGVIQQDPGVEPKP